MLSTRVSRVVVLSLALVAAACGDPTKPKAIYTNTLSTYSLHALTGAPTYGATAISVLGGATHADSRYVFDVAFDLDSTGTTKVYPVRTIAGQLAQLVLASAFGGSVAHVGLQKVSGPFETVREVPSTGYDTLTVQSVKPGEVLALEVVEASCIYSLGGQTLSAKLTVDSVNTTSRRIFVRTVVDPNCGYRSVVPDSIPSH